MISVGIFAAVPILYYVHKTYLQKNNKSSSSSSSANSIIKSTSANDLLNSLGDYQLRPPFPPIIRNMLSNCSLAYLSTVDKVNSTSHLSLMRFTYLDDGSDGLGEIVIMTTRRNTKKFDMLTKQQGVALLIHDFPNPSKKDNDATSTASTSTSGIYSITLNGKCIILQDDAKSEELRQEHLKRNSEYSQFIVGDEIAVLCVIIDSARICNINDEVIHWNADKI